MQAVYRWFTAVLFVAVVAQVGLIGYAIFFLGHKIDKEGSVTEDSVSGPFEAHALLGTVIVAAMLILFLLTLAGRLGRSKRRWTGGLLVLGVLQFVFAEAGFAVPAIGSLHPVNALAIFVVSGAMAHRAWLEGRSDAPLARVARTPSG